MKQYLCGVLFAAALLGLSSGCCPQKATPEQKACVEKVLPAVVRIEAIRLIPEQGRMVKSKVGGSGAIISPEGHVVTNYHVAQDADFYRCHLTDGSVIEATRVGQDALSDLAILKLKIETREKGAAPLPLAKFGSSAQLKPGDLVYALGSPASMSQAVTRGIISHPAMVLPDTFRFILDGENVGTVVRWILHDASIFPGNSGGPLISEEGVIIGINEIGVANLGGAIPADLAKKIVDQIIKSGHVTRGWSGLGIQSRLEASGQGDGILVASVIEKSPAAAAGIKPGDLILRYAGEEMAQGKENSIANFNRIEMGHMPGDEVLIEYSRNGNKATTKLKLVDREPAKRDDLELLGWGTIVQDLTLKMAIDENLPDKNGVWIENVRPGGPAGQAEPELRRSDVIIAVDNQPVANIGQLKTLTEKLLKDAPNGVRSVLASFRRDGAVLCSVVELRLTNERHITPQARKAWLGAANQPLTPKLGKSLGIKAEGGARLTRIYPGTLAEQAGLKVGDVILAIDDIPVTARRAEDTDVLARQIRQYKAGSETKFSIWREGKKIEVPVKLEVQPIPASELPWWEDERLEFSVHEIAFEDRTSLQLPPDASGLIVETTAPAGWASLAGLRVNDLIVEADGAPIRSIADIRRSREQAATKTKEWWVFKVIRHNQTLFVELNLKPIKT